MNKKKKTKFKWKGKETEPKQTQNTDQRNAAVGLQKEKTEQNKKLVQDNILSGNIARFL